MNILQGMVTQNELSRRNAIYPLPNVAVQRVTVVKFTMDNRGIDGIGCFRISVKTDATEFTNMRIAGFGK